jgi:hypothetical protein
MLLLWVPVLLGVARCEPFEVIRSLVWVCVYFFIYIIYTYVLVLVVFTLVWRRFSYTYCSSY